MPRRLVHGQGTEASFVLGLGGVEEWVGLKQFVDPEHGVGLLAACRDMHPVSLKERHDAHVKRLNRIKRRCSACTVSYDHAIWFCARTGRLNSGRE